jgi:uncharacterized repeat protein (TIGR01451 family)
MKTAAARRITNLRLCFVMIGLILSAAVLAVSSHSAGSNSLTPPAREPKQASSITPKNRRLPGWTGNPSLATVAGETVEIFAADCTTSKTEFALGEVICAKTDGVDLTVPNNYYMNWHHPDNTTTNGGTITQNPQFFVFSLPTTGANEVGTWKANIGRVTPAEPSIIGNPPLFTVDASGAMATFASDCLTPKTTFALGETVCARATGLVGFRIAWQDAAGYIEKRVDITTDPQTDTFTLPTDQTSVIGDITVDNRGQWRANAITSRNSVRRSAFFTVTDPQNPVVNLSITKSLLGDNVQQGGQVQYEVVITNNGPDDAANVHFVDDTFTGATFNSVTETSALGFVCTGSGSADCTLASLSAGARATFLLNFTAGSAGSTLQNTAEVTSDTSEQNALDNTFTTGAEQIGSGTPPPACTLNCPNNINAVANTEENNQRGAHVDYAAPTVSDEDTCGTVTTSPASGSFFPVGTTTVVATSASGNGSCSFTITVTDTGEDPPTISCPVNKTGTADATCAAAISVGTATATGTNVTVIGFRSDGRPMYTCDANDTNCVRNSSDEPFPAGVTTITWIAFSHNAPGPYADADDEEARRTGSASCTQTITVDDVTAPTITATDSTVAADASCQAAVPDYSNSASDNCACSSSDESETCVGREVIVVNQSMAAGTLVGPGTYTITLTANDGSSNNGGAGNTSTKTITFTVEDQTAPSITCPANVVTTTDAGSCSATVDPGTATATDNCDSTPTIGGTRSDNQPLNAPYPKGVTTITWTATDDAGNSSSCQQTVTVNDEEPPAISCPADITVGNDAGQCGAVVTYTAPVGTDNCAGANTVQTAGLPSGSQFPVGTTTNTFEVTDASGNKTSCSFTVTVNDVENPVISCPANIVLEPTCPSGAIGNWTAPVGTDNCPGAVTTRTEGPAPGSTFAAGTTTTITYTVNDAHGHSASCSFTVTVKSVLQTIDDLRASVAANQQLTGPQRNGLLSKLDAAKQHIQNGNQNGACSKLADFVNSVQNFINHGDLSATTGNAWISTANNIRNAIGCTSNPCS